jgi:hypothetical protein
VKGKSIRSVFWALVAMFIVLVMLMLATPAALPPAFRGAFLWIFFTSGAVSFLLGVALIVLTVKEKIRGMPKKFLLLTGASAVGLPVFGLLHNAIYALFICWFGADFWSRTGLEDEPVFFILAAIICPLGFLTGIVGSLVLAARNKGAELPSGSN